MTVLVSMSSKRGWAGVLALLVAGLATTTAGAAPAGRPVGTAAARVADGQRDDGVARTHIAAALRLPSSGATKTGVDRAAPIAGNMTVQTPATAWSGRQSVSAGTQAAPLCLPPTTLSDRCPEWVDSSPSVPTSTNDGPQQRYEAASPDGATLFVAGGRGVVADDAATGAQRWAVDNPQLGSATAVAVMVTHSGATVVVAAMIMPGCQLVVASYDTGTGRSIWTWSRPCTAVWPAAEDDEDGAGVSLAVSSDDRIVVLGANMRCNTCQPYYRARGEILGYDAGSGALRWGRQFWSDDCEQCQLGQLVPSPDGRTLYATGWRFSPDSSANMATEAYDTLTGGRRWATPDTAGACDKCWVQGSAVAAGEDGRYVYVVEYTDDFKPSPPTTACRVVALLANGGQEAWRAAPASATACASAYLAVTPTAVIIGAWNTANDGVCAAMNGTVLASYDGARGTLQWRIAPDLTQGCGGSTLLVGLVATPSQIVVVQQLYAATAWHAGGVQVLAYTASSGAPSWASRYDTRADSPGDIEGITDCVGDSRGHHLFVAGYDQAFSGLYVPATGNFVIAYDISS